MVCINMKRTFKLSELYTFLPQSQIEHTLQPSHITAIFKTHNKSYKEKTAFLQLQNIDNEDSQIIKIKFLCQFSLYY